MRNIEIVISGDQEEEMGRKLLESVDKVIQDYVGMEVSVRADTVTGSTVQNFGFRNHKPGRAERRG